MSKPDSPRPPAAYPKPPIVEAIVEVQFAPPLGREAIVAALESAVGSKYPRERVRHDIVKVKADLVADTVSTEMERTPHATQFKSGDDLRTLTCVNGALAVHVLAPYPGWVRFREIITEAFTALREAHPELAVKALSVRYIDRIRLPMGNDTNYADWLTVIPLRPDAMPGGLDAFHIVTQATDPSDGTTATLTLVSQGQEAVGIPIVIYDLVLRRTGEPLCSLADAHWQPIVDRLHERQREIFEDSITDRLRETFQ